MDSIQDMESCLKDIKRKTAEVVIKIKELDGLVESFNNRYDSNDMIMELYNKNKSIAEIARRVNLSYSTVYSRVKVMQNKGTLKKRGIRA